MKRIAILILFFVVCEFGFAEEFETNVYLGSLGIGGSYTFIENKMNFDFKLELMDVQTESKSTNIVIQMTPINYYYTSLNNNHIFSILNITLSWDALGSGDPRGEFLGPFLTMHALNINFENSDTKIDYIGISAGLRIILDPLLGFEFGYKYINGRHNSFILFRCDLLHLIAAPLILSLI